MHHAQSMGSNTAHTLLHEHVLSTPSAMTVRGTPIPSIQNAIQGEEVLPILEREVLTSLWCG